MRFNQLLTLLVISLACVYSFYADAASHRDREYQIKSAFISNFIRYARWQNLPSDHFNFCSTNSRFHTIVELSLDQERWHNRNPVFSIVAPGQENHCQVLFIDRESTQLWQHHLLEHPKKNLLLIGEKQGFARHVGHINFFIVDNKLRFEINSQRLKLTEVDLSSSLLRLARLVTTLERLDDQ